MLRADPGKRAEIDRAIAKNGRWVWKFDNPILGYVEYIEFDSMYEVDQEMKDDLPVEDPDELAAVEAALMAPAAPAAPVAPRAPEQRMMYLRRRRAPAPAAPAAPAAPPPAAPAAPPAAARPPGAAGGFSGMTPEQIARMQEILRRMEGGKGGGKGK